MQNDCLVNIELPKWSSEWRVGREGVDIVLPGLKISDLHAIILVSEDSRGDIDVWVEDRSLNGTFVNGTKIGSGGSSILRHGDEITFATPPGSGFSLPMCEQYRQSQHFCPVYLKLKLSHPLGFIFQSTVATAQQQTLLGKYELARELGSGSFGVVHEAINRTTGVRVAVKTIKASKFTNPREQKQLAREIDIMTRFEHPNVCKLVEVLQDAGSGDMHLVMELVKGTDVLNYILERPFCRLHEEEVVFLTRQLCTAMAYIHSQGVAHRDLKPENILLQIEKDGAEPVVKVTDFGLSKHFGDEGMLMTFVGTLVYAAPEMCREGKKVYTHLVDSWSTGLTIFAMLTGKNGVRNAELLAESPYCLPVVDLSLLKHPDLGLSKEAKHFIHALLEFDPNQRMGLTDALSHPWLTREKSPASVGNGEGVYPTPPLTRHASLEAHDTARAGSTLRPKRGIEDEGEKGGNLPKRRNTLKASKDSGRKTPRGKARSRK
ncbi:kinase-like domain-containing protein [Coprinopsis sp. MPI-PUGE-AT-0042]|nr:kinase-like domain-containing protein [Coprinopsis sp. MPI-PUGE-AT-0042]